MGAAATAGLLARSHDAGARCLCSDAHRPLVLEYEHHHVWPKGMGGPDVPANLVWLCPTTHTNAHELMRLLQRGQLTPALRAEVTRTKAGRYALALAELGLLRDAAGALVGELPAAA